jgi:hypothetical protein
MLQCKYNHNHPDHYDLELLANDVRSLKQLAVRASENVNSLTAKSFWREQNSYFLVGTYSIST